MPTTRWNVAVSTETDQALRVFLANQGGGRKGDLSRFIEEAGLQPAKVGMMIDNLQRSIVLERLPQGVDAADPDDALLLAMAELGSADFLVTGDRLAGLIERVHYGRTRIVTPTQFCSETLTT